MNNELSFKNTLQSKKDAIDLNPFPITPLENNVLWPALNMPPKMRCHKFTVVIKCMERMKNKGAPGLI